MINLVILLSFKFSTACNFFHFRVEAVLRLMGGTLISYAITISSLFDNIQKYAIFLRVFSI